MLRPIKSKEEHENYFTNGFDFIEITELEVKS